MNTTAIVLALVLSNPFNGHLGAVALRPVNMEACQADVLKLSMLPWVMSARCDSWWVPPPRNAYAKNSAGLRRWWGSPDCLYP
jgi:hypothetical protein